MLKFSEEHYDLKYMPEGKLTSGAKHDMDFIDLENYIPVKRGDENEMVIFINSNIRRSNSNICT
mgnify:CR=1 FL=1